MYICNTCILCTYENDLLKTIHQISNSALTFIDSVVIIKLVGHFHFCIEPLIQ